MYKGIEIPAVGFAGGFHSNVPVTEVAENEAYDLSNIVLNHNGRGFRTRYNNSAFNASAMNGGVAVQGLGYLNLSTGSDFLMAICGDKAFSSAGLSGTMTDRTNGQTITLGQNNIWTPVVFNDVQVWFGGPPTNPDVPLSTAGGVFTALAGSPPSAYGAFQANNRIFAFRTAANPSTIYWSILGNQANWTGAGSGSANVWTSDNDSLTAAAVLDNSTVLLFKENSIQKMLIGTLVSNAFPIVPLFAGVGCAGKHACVVAYGLCYFITTQGKMQITDGQSIIDDRQLPALANIDDQWAAFNTSRYKYVQGIHVAGSDYDHIIWCVSSTSSQTTNDWGIIWDLKNKCWLRHKTGFKANVLALKQSGTLYSGHYDGTIYLQDATTTSTTDASESNVNIDSYWMSGWQKKGQSEKIKQPRKATISFTSQSQGSIVFSYGFDYGGNIGNVTIDQTSPGATYDVDIYDDPLALYSPDSDYTRPVRIVGRGNLFQWKLRNNSFKMKINTVEFSGKSYGQKEVGTR